jgi:hypothetical protein|tara:strand:+ start:154 stop:462 length:309 start_codon:yes stop_codon:yes gene_type:complete
MKSVTNTITKDIFMEESFLAKLPKGWNYSKVRSYLTKVANHPQKFTTEQKEYAVKLSGYLAYFYNTNHWIITPQVKDGLLSQDRWSKMNTLNFIIKGSLIQK